MIGEIRKATNKDLRLKNVSEVKRNNQIQSMKNAYQNTTIILYCITRVTQIDFLKTGHLKSKDFLKIIMFSELYLSKKVNIIKIQC